MALSQATLKTELLKIMDPDNPSFVGHPDNVNDAAANWAAAYDTYALNAADYSGDALASANAPGFETTLANMLPAGDPGGTAATAAAAFEAAFIMYWTGAVFAVGIVPPPTGVCPNIGGNTIFGLEATSAVITIVPNILIPLLVAAWANPLGTEDPDAAATIAASAFHTATTTAVFVLISGTDTTPPPAGPLPITNTCTVF